MRIITTLLCRPDHGISYMAWQTLILSSGLGPDYHNSDPGHIVECECTWSLFSDMTHSNWAHMHCSLEVIDWVNIYIPLSASNDINCIFVLWFIVLFSIDIWYLSTLSNSTLSNMFGREWGRVASEVPMNFIEPPATRMSFVFGNLRCQFLASSWESLHI